MINYYWKTPITFSNLHPIFVRSNQNNILDLDGLRTLFYNPLNLCKIIELDAYNPRNSNEIGINLRSFYLDSLSLSERRMQDDKIKSNNITHRSFFELFSFNQMLSSVSTFDDFLSEFCLYVMELNIPLDKCFLNYLSMTYSFFILANHLFALNNSVSKNFIRLKFFTDQTSILVDNYIEKFIMLFLDFISHIVVTHVNSIILKNLFHWELKNSNENNRNFIELEIHSWKSNNIPYLLSCTHGSCLIYDKQNIITSYLKDPSPINLNTSKSYHYSLRSSRSMSQSNNSNCLSSCKINFFKLY